MFLAGMDYRAAPGQGGTAHAKPATAFTSVPPANADAARGGHIFSQRAINAEPVKKFDAHLQLKVKQLRAAAMPLDSVQLAADLVDGAVELSVLDLGAVGGHVAGSLTFDARPAIPEARASLEARNLRLERLLSAKPSAVPSEAGIRSQLKISARGKSLADMAANANGTLVAIVDGGSISNLVDAKLGLNLGKVLGLRIRGDQPIALHCGAAAFEFRNGIGKSQALLLDTEQTHTDGTGIVNLREQTFELLLTPQPKKPGLFTLNSSIRVQGAFKNASFKVDDRVPLKKGGAAAPTAIATLFRPLLKERRTDSSCARVLAPARTETSQGKKIN
jgi:uncharacterized protein involved in outer membrane biogenesis